MLVEVENSLCSEYSYYICDSEFNNFLLSCDEGDGSGGGDGYEFHLGINKVIGFGYGRGDGIGRE